jgi:hypothetical protein
VVPGQGTAAAECERSERLAAYLVVTMHRALLLASLARLALALVHVPVERDLLPPSHRGAHALVNLQRHLNHAERRAALYAGREPPSHAEEVARLVRRYKQLATPTTNDAGAPSRMRKRQAATATDEVRVAAPSAVKAEPVTGFGNVPLDLYAYQGAVVGYTMTMMIGTPPKAYTMMIDTVRSIETCRARVG